MLDKLIYLDNNATTSMAPGVLDAMLPYFGKKFGNASSLHTYGQAARSAVDVARMQVASFLHADPEEIIFTSGGTEADNLALKGIALLPQNVGRHIITSAIEHHAVLNSCLFLEELGYQVTYVSVDATGKVAVDAIAAAITDNTFLISIMAANNEVGTLQPVAAIGALARSRGILFHTDAVQAVGKIDIDVQAMHIDLLSLSGHKINGPKGVGALYVRKGIPLSQLVHGGHHENNHRAGTENVPSIVGLGVATQLMQKNGAAEVVRLTQLRNRLWDGLHEALDAVYLNGHGDERLATTLNVSFGYIEGEALLLNFDLVGVAVSSGSACTSGTPEPSHVLLAMGVDRLFAQGAIRFSLGQTTNSEEIEYVIKQAIIIVRKLRAMSPLYSRREKYV